MAKDYDTELDTTIEALSSDLTAIKPDAATEVISGWRRSLSQSSNKDLNKISDDLGELKDALSSATLDGKRIGTILKSLGEQTTAAAKNADQDVGKKIARLGSLLTKAGNTLG